MTKSWVSYKRLEGQFIISARIWLQDKDKYFLTSNLTDEGFKSGTQTSRYWREKMTEYAQDVFEVIFVENEDEDNLFEFPENVSFRLDTCLLTRSRRERQPRQEGQRRPLFVRRDRFMRVFKIVVIFPAGYQFGNPDEPHTSHLDFGGWEPDINERNGRLQRKTRNDVLR